MTDMGKSWITDTEISDRFRYYTRANADEVGPDPFSPLGWSLGWVKGCIPGVASGFVKFGVLDWDEFDLDPPEVFGNWGGYFYNQLSLPRMMGCRMPGASPEAIDQAYFGDHPGVPPYIAHPDDDNEAAAAKLGETMAWVMSTDSFPDQDAASQMAHDAVNSRPDLAAATDAELVAYARSMAPKIDEAWVPYCEVCLGASLGPGAVQAITAAVGRPEDAVKVLSAVGGVESADASFVMWDISRLVRNSTELSQLFDGGFDGLLERLDTTSADGAAFHDAWSALMEVHGHRGPNEWDMRAHSWTTKPGLALGMLERLRHQSDSKSPHAARDRAAAERERLSAELLALVEGDAETHGTFAAALSSAALFVALREKGKNACIRIIHEAKLAIFELGRRMVERGVATHDQAVFNLLDDELDAFLAEPESFSNLLVEREEQFQELHRREPPYIIGKDDGVAPISEWPVRGAVVAESSVSGDVLQGAAGAPGVATGRARIILDPSDPSAIEPGDILVAPTTDPSWTPLFLSAAGVVVNVGAVASHAAIVCRELGVPCAVSVVQATQRIPDGATITVDGSTGAVTLL